MHPLCNACPISYSETQSETRLSWQMLTQQNQSMHESRDTIISGDVMCMKVTVSLHLLLCKQMR